MAKQTPEERAARAQDWAIGQRSVVWTYRVTIHVPGRQLAIETADAQARQLVPDADVRMIESRLTPAGNWSVLIQRRRSPFGPDGRMQTR